MGKGSPSAKFLTFSVLQEFSWLEASSLPRAPSKHFSFPTINLDLSTDGRASRVSFVLNFLMNLPQINHYFVSPRNSSWEVELPCLITAFRLFQFVLPPHFHVWDRENWTSARWARQKYVPCLQKWIYDRSYLSCVEILSWKKTYLFTLWVAGSQQYWGGRCRVFFYPFLLERKFRNRVLFPLNERDAKDCMLSWTKMQSFFVEGLTTRKIG